MMQVLYGVMCLMDTQPERNVSSQSSDREASALAPNALLQVVYVLTEGVVTCNCLQVWCLGQLGSKCPCTPSLYLNPYK